ncbi:3' exoribonuclease family, domain 1 domain-containing protein [Phthorimaea operculella]|nr:3' exoribonuclease family, domain 1 domain-containing protein [Phthorimaea operculella]
MPGPELLSSQGLRLDGRRPNELRRIRCKLGVFTQPDGSAYLEQGNTKVLAAVYGPHQAAKSKSSTEGVVVNCQYSMATFSTGERKNRPRGDRKSQEMSMHLRQALTAGIKTELYPRSQIDIYVEVLQADGGAYCASVNAATLALIDAGIPLRAYVCACSASMAWRAGEPTPLVDVGHVEEAAGGVVGENGGAEGSESCSCSENSWDFGDTSCLAVSAYDLRDTGKRAAASLYETLSSDITSLMAFGGSILGNTCQWRNGDLDSKGKWHTEGPPCSSIALLEMSHRLHMDYFDLVLNRALQGCRDINVVLDKAVREHLAEGWTKQDVITI